LKQSSSNRLPWAKASFCALALIQLDLAPAALDDVFSNGQNNPRLPNRSAVFAQAPAKKKSPAELVTDAYSLMLNRAATTAEQQYWNGRLAGKEISTMALIDLYDGLARLPEYRKRFTGLAPAAQIKLMGKTLLRTDTVKDSWIAYLQKHTLSDTIESMLESCDHVMSVYSFAGLINQQEANDVHTAENLVRSNPTQALSIYKSLQTRGSKIPEYYFYMARIYEVVNPKQAIEMYQTGLARYPDYAQAELKLAIIIRNTGAHVMAFNRARHGIHSSDVRIGADTLISNMKKRLDTAKHPEFLSRAELLLRAQVHQFGDQWDEALTELNRALAIGEGDGFVYTTRAAVYESAGKYEQAVADANRAEKLMGESATNTWSRALSLVELGRYETALPDLNKLLKVTPHLCLYVARAKCYGALGRRKEQIADLTVQISLEPRAAKPLIARARAYMSMGKYKEALADANKAVLLAPRLRDGYKLRAEIYDKTNKKALAAADRKTIEQISKLLERKFDF
jgi:tetratricopeptide (TPR) repeat protein